MAQSPPLLVTATLFAIMFALGVGLPLDGLGLWQLRCCCCCRPPWPSPSRLDFLSP
ncbi:MAG: hypothetical protein RLZZ213_1663 [Cyanobacteriota bacterium]